MMLDQWPLLARPAIVGSTSSRIAYGTQACSRSIVVRSSRPVTSLTVRTRLVPSAPNECVTTTGFGRSNSKLMAVVSAALCSTPVMTTVGVALFPCPLTPCVLVRNGG